MTSSQIPREIEDILIDIKYLAGISPGRKYNIESQNYVSATSLFSRLHRTLFTSEDKIKTLSFINQTIGRAIAAAKNHPQWEDHLAIELAKLDDAIINLIHVYSTEPKFIASLETAKMKVDPEAFHRACRD